MTTTVIIIIATGGLSYLLTCWAIIDVALKDFGAIEKKAAWGIVAFIPFIGWIIYFLMGRQKGVRQTRAA
ncbi:MAG: PLD nuclease N-terminal domain-containing protein [Thermodesulfobacteriota bacterium]|nr:PLD nuclease N-terminal domain-containing protein [Thermodesulfobacteriota bacterium]